MGCEENRFCKSLDPEDRKMLCGICEKTRFEKGCVIDQEKFETHVMLILKGAMVTIKASSGKNQFIYIPCDIHGHEYLFNSNRIKYSDYGILQAFRDMEVSWLPTAELSELFMTRPGIAKALFMNVSVSDDRKAYHRLMVSMENSYNAVLYMMLFLKRHGIHNVSHSELAFLCGLNRVTVTRTLKVILSTEKYSELREYLEDGLGKIPSS